MADDARRHKRVVQVGTQQRSGQHYQRARELIRGGHIGKVTSVRIPATRNVTPGFGRAPDGDPPVFDWDLWLGPAPKGPYNPNRCIYHFRWFWDYSGGQTTDPGAHQLDIVDWVLGLDTLRAVTSSGGRFALSDNGETPDTQDALFEFGGWTAGWTMRECSRGEPPTFPLEFCGTRRSLGLSRRAFQVTADPDVPPAAQIPQFAGAHPVGGPVSVKPAGPRKYRTEPLEDRTGDDWQQFKDHVRNFLDCVKSRGQPVSDLESAHRTATACHLKDMRVEESADGFLLSEVPLGEGYVPLKEVAETLRKARPEIRLSLEMITRDRLSVPCLTDRYWTTFADISGRKLAKALLAVRKGTRKDRPVPRVSQLPEAERLAVEDRNVRRSLAYAAEKLGL